MMTQEQKDKTTKMFNDKDISIIEDNNSIECFYENYRSLMISDKNFDGRYNDEQMNNCIDKIKNFIIDINQDIN